MFQRFTSTARRVVVLAQEEARQLMHNHIGPEHLLLGMCQARVAYADPTLTALPDQTIEEARQHVTNIVPRGEFPPSGHIPFDPSAKKILELSLRESLKTGHNSIAPGHLLLAMLHDPDSPGVRALLDMGLDPDRLRITTTAALGTEQPQPDRITALELRVQWLTEQVTALLDQRGKPGAPDDPDGPDQRNQG